MLILKNVISSKFIKIALIVISFVTIFGFVSIAHADNTDTAVTAPAPFRTPTGPGYSLGSWVTVSGFKLQPKDHYYARTGDSVTIKTDVNKNDASSVFGGNLFSGVNYKWYKFDGGKWREIKKSGFLLNHSINNRNYSFKSTTPGTFYFQAFAQVVPILPYFNPPLYSNMTSITFSKDSEVTNSFSIKPQSNYLLVNKDFLKKGYYLDVITDPVTANDIHDIQWSFPDDIAGVTTDKTSNELISIIDNQIFVNKNASSILAHKHLSSEVVKIKGSLINGLGKQIDAYTSVTVGNMLTIKDDQKNFTAGDSSIITLNGDFDDKDEIHWHRVKGAENREFPNSKNTLPLKSLSREDNDTRYYVEIISENPIDKNNPFKVKSNEIHIGVDSINIQNDYDHTISSTYADNTHISNTFNIENAEVTDRLTHTITIINHNDVNIRPQFRENELIYPLSPNEEIVNIDSVKINNDNIKPENIRIDENTVHIKHIPIENFPTKVTIDTIVTKIEKNSFEYAPLFTVYTSDQESYIDPIEPINSISFVNDGIVPIPHNIEFGQIIKRVSSLENRILPDSDNNIVDFNDNRRNKTPAKLELSFSDKFHYGSSNSPITTDSLELRYFDSNQNELGIPSKNLVVEQTKQGESIQPISWQNNEGLKIFVRNTNLDDGIYKSKIVWTTTWSI